MAFIGREDAGVVSLACCPTSTTAFASLSAAGTLTLWDRRLKRRNYLSFVNPNKSARLDASELRFFPQHHTAVALCGDTVQLFDTRHTVSLLAEYQHTCECVDFFSLPLPDDAHTTLVVDEEGAMFAYNIVDGSRPAQLEAYVFGEAYDLPALGVFGHLNSYSSGLHPLQLAPSAAHAAREATQAGLFAVGMDGHGAVYRGVEDTPYARLPFSVAKPLQGGPSGQMVNPPLVTCSTMCDNLAAVGRADGTYAVYFVSDDGIDALHDGRGHAMHGLCYLDWMNIGTLVTATLSGEVTAWDLGALLVDEVDEEEEAGGPLKLGSYAHRALEGCQAATLNCGAHLDESTYLVGDHLGGVAFVSLAF